VNQRPNTLNRSPGSSLSRFVFLLLLSICLMFIDEDAQLSRKVRGAVSTVLYPIYGASMYVHNGVNQVNNYLIERVQLAQQIEVFEHEKILNSVRLQTLDYYRKENQRLRELLNLTSSSIDGYRAAKIIDSSLSPYEHRVVINAGSMEGIEDSTMVLVREGVLGQIMMVNPYTSQVILLSDADHAIPVTSTRTGLRTIAFGAGIEHELILPFVTRDTDIQMGDEFVTSGLGGVFRPGYFVGKASWFEDNASGSFSEIRLEVSYKMNEINNVLLIQGN
jgi:rod shape-determining protein MreC